MAELCRKIKKRTYIETLFLLSRAALMVVFISAPSAMQVPIPPGSLDTTFGTGGKVTTGFGPSNSCDDITAVAVQPDGKIVAAGWTWPTCSAGTLFTGSIETAPGIFFSQPQAQSPRCGEQASTSRFPKDMDRDLCAASK